MNEVEYKVIQYLNEKNFRDASNAVASYEAKQERSRGLGIDWKHHNPEYDISVLTTIFNHTPKILSSLNDTELQPLRIAVGMMYLWGTNRCKKWLPQDFKQNSKFKNDVAAMKLLLFALNRTTIERYKKMGVKKVKVLATTDSCDVCKRLSEKRYNIDGVIELPYEHCTTEEGCRCSIIPIVE